MHSDFPNEVDVFGRSNKYIMEDGIEKKLESVQNGEKGIYQYINWWRATDAMKDPIQAYPLCVLDTSSLVQDDIVLYEAMNAGVPSDCDEVLILLLKYNPNHRWYFYPQMDKDEVLMFKQFELRTGDTIGRMPCYHTAFDDPLAAKGKDVEKRRSFEYRMSYMVPNDS